MVLARVNCQTLSYQAVKGRQWFRMLSDSRSRQHCAETAWAHQGARPSQESSATISAAAKTIYRTENALYKKIAARCVKKQILSSVSDAHMNQILCFITRAVVLPEPVDFALESGNGSLFVSGL